MAEVILAALFVSSGALSLSGLLICSGFLWVGRWEYRFRREFRTWDAYWPIEIPADLLDPLY